MQFCYDLESKKGIAMENNTEYSRIVISHVMLPQDTNPSGNVHGGAIVKLIDTAAGVIAIRHARCNAVTASIDRIDFYHPVYLGNLVTLKANLNMVGYSSMEIGVRVESEDLFTGETKHTASAYLTFVALDKDGRPKKIPSLKFETEEAVRRNREATARKKSRISLKEQERKCQENSDIC